MQIFSVCMFSLPGHGYENWTPISIQLCNRSKHCPKASMQLTLEHYSYIDKEDKIKHLRHTISKPFLLENNVASLQVRNSWLAVYLTQIVGIHNLLAN
jgi:hypothetical protein